jgi:nucleoid-associated protein YgaU
MKRSFRIGLLPIALALTGSLRADDQAAPAQHPDVVASLRADNKQLSDELASAWKEADRLKADIAAAQASSAKSEGEAADLRKQLDAAKAQAPKPEVAPAAPDSDAAKQLADAQDKLSISLRSFSVLQDENTQLKASLEKANSDNTSLAQQLDAARASIAALQGQAAATAQVTAQVDPLRSELRLSQDEANRLAIENAQFRTRLALQSPGPGSFRPAPTRPGQAAAASAAPAEAAAPPAAPAPRTHVVVEGDTLTKISRKYYGTSGRWEDILKANRDILKDEKSLAVGSSLKIP